jgi:hypothetical protein
MKNYTANILIERPFSATYGLMTCRVNGASELYPGHVCTQDGHTWPDVGRPDADADHPLGIVLNNPDADIDAYLADNAEVTVAVVGSGAVVWGYIDDDEGTVAPGERLYHTGADDDGLLEQYVAAAAAPTTYDDATIETAFTLLENEHVRYVGRAVTYNADQGSDDVPIKVALV